MMIKKQLSSSKIQGAILPSEPSDSYLGIVEVREKNYVPTGVKLRKWISDFIFTAEIPSRLISQLDQNPNITSVQLNQVLPTV